MNPESESNSTGFRKGAEGLFNIVGKKAQIHNERYDYDSKFMTFGFDLEKLPDGSFFLNPKGVANALDRWGDGQLRRLDDNVIKEPGKLFRRDPLGFRNWVFNRGKRSRGNVNEILLNIQRLHLNEYYGGFKNGIRVKKPEILTEGINLQDMYEIENPVLKEIDLNDAMSGAGAYIRNLHDMYGATGELHPSRIFFQNLEDNKVKDPVLWIPDIVPNWDKYGMRSFAEVAKIKAAKEKYRPKDNESNPPEPYEIERSKIKLREPKATEILEFLAATVSGELQHDDSEEKIKSNLKAFLKGYNDQEMTSAIKSFIHRGRLTIVSDADLAEKTENANQITLQNSFSKWLRKGVGPISLSVHNSVHVGATDSVAGKIKPIILDVCEELLA